MNHPDDPKTEVVPESDDELVIERHLKSLRKEVEPALPVDVVDEQWTVDDEAEVTPVPGIFGTGAGMDDISRYHRLFRVLVAGGLVLLLAAGLGVYWFTSRQVTVPDLIGVSSATAIQRLDEVGLVVGELVEQEVAGVEPGTVVDQAPRVDETVAPGSKVKLVVATESAFVVVPKVIGQPVEAARASFSSARLVIQEVPVYSDAVAIGSVVGQLPVEGTQVAVQSEVTVLVAKGPVSELVSVPKVLGLTQEQATKLLTDLGLQPKFYQASTTFGNLDEAAAQIPASKTAVYPGSTVQVLISRGSSSTEDAVPNVVGQTKEQARTLLEQAGFVVEEIPMVDSAVPIGSIVGQMPVADGVLLRKGETVGVLVSRGPSAEVVMPDLLGMTLEQAQQTIKQYGLVPIVAGSKDSAQAAVTQQFPAAGQKYTLGMSVLVYAGTQEK